MCSMALSSAAIRSPALADVGEHIVRREVDDPAEAGDQMAARHRKAAEAEVGEVGIAGRLRVDAPGSGGGASGRRRAAPTVPVSDSRAPASGSPPSPPGATRSSEACGSRVEIPGVDRQPGNQQDRLAGGRGRHRHQRGEGRPLAIERCKRPGRRQPQTPGGRPWERRIRPAMSCPDLPASGMPAHSATIGTRRRNPIWSRHIFAAIVTAKRVHVPPAAGACPRP